MSENSRRNRSAALRSAQPCRASRRAICHRIATFLRPARRISRPPAPQCARVMRSIEGVPPAGARRWANRQTAGLNSQGIGAGQWRTPNGSNGGGHPAARVARARAAACSKASRPGSSSSLALALAVFIVTTPALRGARRRPLGRAATSRTPTAARSPRRSLFTDVRMDVTGMIARVTVKQRFVNPTGEWREGVYVFPLPEKAAVDHLRMQIGERVIEGHDQGARRGAAHLRQREARRPQGDARRAGAAEHVHDQRREHRAARGDRRRDRVPGDAALRRAARSACAFRWRSRRATSPARRSRRTPTASAGRRRRSRCSMPIASRRRSSARSEGYVLPVTIAIDLDAGFALSNLASTLSPDDDRRAARPSLPPDARRRPGARRARLRARVDARRRRRARRRALHRDQGRQDLRAADGAAADARRASRAARPPREITYIIDTSGSMEGVSIVQARESLLLALDRLQPGDRFNVIEFNSATALAVRGAGAGRCGHAGAREAVRRAACAPAAAPRCCPALEIALAGAREASILRQVVFLTDGAVGNEDADPAARRRAHRRPAPVHRRHRPRAEHVLHDQGRAVRPRHVHRPSATCAKCRRR